MSSAKELIERVIQEAAEGSSYYAPRDLLKIGKRFRMVRYVQDETYFDFEFNDSTSARGFAKALRALKTIDVKEFGMVLLGDNVVSANFKKPKTIPNKPDRELIAILKKYKLTYVETIGTGSKTSWVFKGPTNIKDSLGEEIWSHPRFYYLAPSTYPERGLVLIHLIGRFTPLDNLTRKRTDKDPWEG